MARRVSSSLLVAPLGLLWSTGVALAQDQAPQVQAAVAAASAAATDAAVRGLKAQIDQLPLSPPLPLPNGQPPGATVTVGQYLRFVGGDDYMLATLARAQLIGGPRQLVPAGPVQVRLDISGRLVANALGQIAAVHRNRSPYAPDDVLRAAQFWADRTFTATGASTGEVLGLAPGTPIPPPPTPPSPNPQPPGAALVRQPSLFPPAPAATTPGATPHGAPPPLTPSAARPNPSPAPPALPASPPAAVDVTPLMPDSAPQGLTPDTTPPSAGSASIIPPANSSSANSPSASPASAVPPAASFASSFTAVTAVPAQAASPLASRISLDRPPAWYFDTIDAGGSAPPGGSKLLTARAAEDEALRNLRRQIDALELSPGLKLADAVQFDPRLAVLAPRALDRTRVYRIDYLEDGSVSVRVSTDPRYLWQDLAALMPPPAPPAPPASSPR